MDWSESTNPSIIHNFIQKIILNKIFNISPQSSWQILAMFSLLAIILRFFSFFPSVIDHDESTYLEIARMLLAGKTLYVDMTDIKPPGIFFILAGFQTLFGYSVFVLRLVVALWIGLTAFMICLTTDLLVRDKRASIASGILYIFFISTWSFYGVSITPEIFFNLFTISALYVLLKMTNPFRYFLAGLIAGLGFIVKYLVLFDFAAFILFFVFFQIENRKSKIENRIFYLSISAAGFLLPFGITNFWYYLNGHFDAFYNITYLAPSKYPAAFNPRKMLKFLLDFQLRFFPFFLFYYYALFYKGIAGNEISRVRQLGITWSVMALVAVLLAGKTFGHYMIQLMLPVSIVAALFFHSGMTLPFRMRYLTRRKAGLFLMVIMILLVTFMKLEYVLRKDIPREIAAYLEPKLKADDVIYTGNYHHIIYYLLQKDSPTKYVHRSLLLGKHHIKALDINVEEEFKHIMTQRPLYIIVQKEYPVLIMQDFIDENYTLEKDFEDGVLLFRLREI